MCSKGDNNEERKRRKKYIKNLFISIIARK